MIFNYKYANGTSVASNANSTDMSFAPDALRQPTFFVGTLEKSLSFREAMSALHHVVVSDLRFQPKDKTTYKAWAAQNELAVLAELTAGKKDIEAEMKVLREEMTEIAKEKDRVLSPFYKARKKYYDYLYQKDRDAWFVLDPVITVHPDEVFFECFSQDESTYGRLGCSYEVFKKINEFECGTTNIDYSAALYNEFQKIREYKATEFKIDPSGFDVKTTNEDTFTEVKIDLPDTWVRGFLQVSSAMTLPAYTFDLHPMDVHNILHILKRQKEIIGPRSLRFRLKPGQPVSILVEPFGILINCPRSIYNGDTEGEVRIWGRRRLLILERLLPVTKRFTVHLMGTGLPSFFVADMGHMNFTLGLSGWTSNDWSRAGNFDLMAPRVDVDNTTKQLIFNSLKQNWAETSDSLAQRLGLQKKIVEGALSAYTQAGRVIFDLNKKVYRVRELSREPLPMEQLRFDNPREAKATELIKQNSVNLNTEALADGATKLSGVVKDGGRKHNVELVIDTDDRMRQTQCNCHFYIKNRMRMGPCEHLLALKMSHAQRSVWYKKLFAN
jgi:hypothetical protein